MSKRVIVIVSSHPELAGEPNGTYLPELTHALEVLDKAGIPYDLASPEGGEIPGYGADADETTKEMLADPAFAKRLKTTAKLADVDPKAYDAVYYPGGYGLLFDLVDNEESARIAAALYERGCPISAVCHGPAALTTVTLTNGTPLLEGKRATGFTREEEIAMSTLDKVPFLVEQAIMDKGATYQKRSAWKELVVVDGLVITGQNPGSAAGVGRALVKALK